MKEDIHPKWYPEAKVICNGEVIMTVGSTQPELHVEIWSGTHPFYTGQQRLLDTEGQVERFLKRLQRREDLVAEADEQKDAMSPLAASIEQIPLGTRAHNAFKSAGVNTVGDALNLVQQGDDAVLAITGVGQKALIDLKKFLRAQGLL